MLLGIGDINHCFFIGTLSAINVDIVRNDRWDRIGVGERLVLLLRMLMILQREREGRLGLEARTSMRVGDMYTICLASG